MLRADPSAKTPAHRTMRDTWLDLIVVALTLALLLSGFRSVIQGSDWWVTTVLVAALTALTCGVVRAVGGSRWVAPIALVVGLWALSWIFVPASLFAVVPTPATFRELGDLASAAQRIIIEEQAPVAAARPIVLVITSSFGLLVVIADQLLGRRRSAQTLGVLFVAIFATPALISGKTPSVWLFLAVAALWLVILRSRTTTLGGSPGRRQRGPAVILAAGALAAAVAFPLVAPDIGAVAASWGKPPPAVFGRGINPMLELGQNLRRNAPLTALTYTTSLDEAPYLKVATLRDFTGKTWRPSGSRGFDRFEGQVGIDPDIEVDRATTTITIRELRSSMLPVPYPALNEVTGLKGSWFWERVGMTLRSEQDDSRGQKYSVPSLDLQPTATEMRGLSTTVGPSLQPYVDLPGGLPDIIADTARRVTDNDDNDYDKAIALQDYLRDGDFTYSETAPVADDYDGNGLTVISEFLKRKAGYCVHFSSTMAVMARTLDIPSRVAVGYAPGEVTGLLRSQNQYEVTSDDLHAWTELYFNGIGWVQFEPTPGVGAATSFAEPDEPAPAPSSEEAPGAALSDTPDDAERLDSVESSSQSTTQTAPRTALVTLAGVLLLVAAPGTLRSLRRRWRLRRGAESPDPLWRELEDTSRDFGLATSVTETPRGFAGRLRQRPGVDAAALDSLLRRVETARFARATLQDGDGVDDLRGVVASLHAGASRRERLRATVLPRSLAGRQVATVIRPKPAGPSLLG